MIIKPLTLEPTELSDGWWLVEIMQIVSENQHRIKGFEFKDKAEAVEFLENLPQE